MKRETLTAKELTQANEETKRLILASMTIEEVLRPFRPKDVVAHLKREDVLAHFKLEDVLAHLKLEDIENYVTQLKQNHNVPRKPKPRKNGSRA